MTNYLIQQLYLQAERHRYREFFRYKPEGSDKWESVSWSVFFEDIKRTSRALYILGIEPESRIVLCSPNRPGLLVAEYGCIAQRMVSVPIYTYSSSSQFAYIAEQSGSTMMFVDGAGPYEMAMKYCATHPGAIKVIVVYGDRPEETPQGVKVLTWLEFLSVGDDTSVREKAREICRSATPDDAASLIYTSGTTGDPKGVIITHRMLEAQIKDHIKRLTQVSEGDLSLSFLPMSHIFEKAWLYYCVCRGLRVAFNYDPHDIEKTLIEVQPNVMCCVPRFWEKIYSGIMEVISKMSWFERVSVRQALKVGAKVNLKYRRTGMPVPPLLMKQYQFWDHRFFRKARRKIGIDRGVIFPTAGAALSDKICHFMRSLGIELVYGYGMTETTATVTCYPTVGYEIGTVGTPMEGVNIRIANSGEILVQGPTVTPGYYNNEEANNQAFTEDGWFRTGDMGFLDRNGALILTSRKKDIIKTANGKYVAPLATESRLASNKYIDEVAIVGEGKKYISALVVPNFGYLRAWAKEQQIPFSSTQQLCEHEQVIEFMLTQMQEMQADLADFEKIKNITLLPEPFSADKGEVTNTMKIRRAIISNNYAEHISKMYPDEWLDDEPEDL